MDPQGLLKKEKFHLLQKIKQKIAISKKKCKNPQQKPMRFKVKGYVFPKGFFCFNCSDFIVNIYHNY